MACSLGGSQRPVGRPLGLGACLLCCQFSWSITGRTHPPRSKRRPASSFAARRQERTLDPLEEALTDTWGNPEEGQWDYEYPSEAEFLDTVYQVCSRWMATYVPSMIFLSRQESLRYCCEAGPHFYVDSTL